MLKKVSTDILPCPGFPYNSTSMKNSVHQGGIYDTDGNWIGEVVTVRNLGFSKDCKKQFCKEGEAWKLRCNNCERLRKVPSAT